MVCAADHCSHSLEGRRPDCRFCSPKCQHRARRRRIGIAELDPPLSPYWREFLRRFDRALRQRTPEAWAAYREMAPVGSGEPQCMMNRPLAELLWTLEA